MDSVEEACVYKAIDHNTTQQFSWLDWCQKKYILLRKILWTLKMTCELVLNSLFFSKSSSESVLRQISRTVERPMNLILTVRL